MYIPSRQAEKALGVHANTLRKWADEGLISYIRIPSGQRRYDVESYLKQNTPRRKICYCRVSSHKQSDDLERQVAYLKAHYPDHEIIKDIGSGINFKRKGLLALLDSICKGDVQQVVVAHRDRLARFGFELIQWFADKHSTELVVLEGTSLSPTGELIEDLLTVVNVFSCRLHGLRKYSKALEKDKTLPESGTESSAETVVGDFEVCLQQDDSSSETTGDDS